MSKKYNSEHTFEEDFKNFKDKYNLPEQYKLEDCILPFNIEELKEKIKEMSWEEWIKCMVLLNKIERLCDE